MTATAPWLDLEVVHGYFADAASGQFDFLPDSATAGWLHRNDVYLRPRGHRLAVHRLGRGRAMAESVNLRFQVTARDVRHASYSGALGVALADGCDVIDIDQGGQTADARRRFTVAIHALAASDGRVQLAIASRALIWQYLLIGDWAALAGDNGLAVVPAVASADAATFVQDPDIRMPDGRPATVFRSTAPIALAERGGRRFRLVARDGAGGSSRVVVDALPAPDPANLAMADIAGEASLICQIFMSR